MGARGWVLGGGRWWVALLLLVTATACARPSPRPPLNVVVVLVDDLGWPMAQGFAETVGVNHAGQPSSFFHPYRRANTSPQDVPDFDDGQDGDYLTDRLTDVAIDFLERHRDQPFFYVLSHYAVRTPIQAPEDITARYLAKAGGEPDTSETTDRSLGRILDQLDALGIADRTAVVCLSDNGGLSTLPARPEQHLDGVSLAPALRGAPLPADRALYRLDQDLSERTNLVETEPDRAQALHDLMTRWRTEVGARMPAPNPEWKGQD